MREEWREEEDGWSFTLAMRSFPRVTSGDVDRFVTAPVPNMCNRPQEPCSASAAPPSISSVASPNKASTLTKAKAHRRGRATLNIETTPTHHLRIRASAGPAPHRPALLIFNGLHISVRPYLSSIRLAVATSFGEVGAVGCSMEPRSPGATSSPPSPNFIQH